jgi:Flp pilus assembly protein TadB
MITTCPRCGAQHLPQTRFCTNCGADLSGLSGAPPQSSVPSWASAQQMTGFSSGQGQQALKALLLAIVGIIAGTLLALALLVVLAILIPQFRVFFFFIILALLVLVWIVYTIIRRRIHRAFGRIERLWWPWLS